MSMPVADALADAETFRAYVSNYCDSASTVRHSMALAHARVEGARAAGAANCGHRAASYDYARRAASHAFRACPSLKED